jgi:hypothetical protein
MRPKPEVKVIQIDRCLIRSYLLRTPTDTCYYMMYDSVVRALSNKPLPALYLCQWTVRSNCFEETQKTGPVRIG